MEDNNKIKEKVMSKIAISKLKEENIAMEKNKKYFNKNMAIAASLVIVMLTGVAFAKDIEQYFKSLFTNSTEAIDVAVENGYVQNEEMDYVYDNEIGIKVDSLILDDINLDISFNFETQKENIKLIRFNDFIITNDNDKVVFRSEIKNVETLDELPIYNSLTWMSDPIKLTDTTYTDSILLGLREHEEFKELYFDIQSVKIIYTDDSQEIIEGTWKFNVAISDEMRQNTIVEYTFVEENEYIESGTATLSATGMILNLNLYEPFDLAKYIEDNIEELDDTGLIYIKYNNELLSPSYITYGTFENTQIVANYDNIGTYFKNIDKLEIYIKPFDTNIILENKNN